MKKEKEDRRKRNIKNGEKGLKNESFWVINSKKSDLLGVKINILIVGNRLRSRLDS